LILPVKRHTGQPKPLDLKWIANFEICHPTEVGVVRLTGIPQKYFSGPDKDWLMLSDLQVSAGLRGKGYANLLLSEATRYADKHEKNLFLTVLAFTGKDIPSGLTNAQLVEFYRKHGFRLVPSNRIRHEGEMVRAWRT
jgi:GNAT superfamily N-acetyltransferase